MALRPEPEPEERHEVVRSEQETEEFDPVRPVRPVDPVDPSGSSHVRRERVVQDVAAERRLRLVKASELIRVLVGILEGLIALRIVLRLIAANPANPFARFVYDFTGFFLA